MKKIYFTLFLASMQMVTFAQQTVKIKVKENTAPCVGVAPMECLQIKEGKEKEWKYFYESIKGFEYEPGYTYRLKVIKTPKKEPIAADASAYDYQLKKLICKKKVKTNQTTATPEFLDKKMILTHMQGQVVGNEKVYLQINSESQTITGKSGCNSFHATYEWNGQNIRVKNGISTMMACDEATMQLENQFKSLIEDTFHIQQTANQVVFLNKNNEPILQFQIPSTSDIWSFIDGKKWKLFMMQHVSQDYGDMYIQFDFANKRVSGSAGCNNFFGSFETTGDVIKFSGMGSTRKMCMDEDVMKHENQFLQLLSDAEMRFDVADQTLNFYKDDKLLLLFGM